LLVEPTNVFRAEFSMGKNRRAKIESTALKRVGGRESHRCGAKRDSRRRVSRQILRMNCFQPDDGYNASDGKLSILRRNVIARIANPGRDLDRERGQRGGNVTVRDSARSRRATRSRSSRKGSTKRNCTLKRTLPVARDVHGVP